MRRKIANVMAPAVDDGQCGGGFDARSADAAIIYCQAVPLTARAAGKACARIVVDIASACPSMPRAALSSRVEHRETFVERTIQNGIPREQATAFSDELAAGRPLEHIHCHPHIKALVERSPDPTWVAVELRPGARHLRDGAQTGHSLADTYFLRTASVFSKKLNAPLEEAGLPSTLDVEIGRNRFTDSSESLPGSVLVLPAEYVGDCVVLFSATSTALSLQSKGRWKSWLSSMSRSGTVETWVEESRRSCSVCMELDPNG